MFMNALAADIEQHRVPFANVLDVYYQSKPALVPPEQAAAVGSYLLGADIMQFNRAVVGPHLSAEVARQHPDIVAVPEVAHPNIGKGETARAWVDWLAFYCDVETLPLQPIQDRELLERISQESAAADKRDSLERVGANLRTALHEVVSSFRLTYTTATGKKLSIPVPYGMVEPGNESIYMGGKASGSQLQDRFNDISMSASERGSNLGIENEESLRECALRNGLMVDCSNFAFRFGEAAYQALGLPGRYEDCVYRDTSEVRALYNGGRWTPAAGLLTGRQLETLQNSERVSVDWICNVFGKQPVTISGAAHMCDRDATVPVALDEVRVGDFVAFTNPNNRVSHVAVVDSASVKDGMLEVDIRHALSSRDRHSGVCLTTMCVDADGRVVRASYDGLRDKERTVSVAVRRSVALDNYYKSL
jgi:hypothetical protein